MDLSLLEQSWKLKCGHTLPQDYGGDRTLRAVVTRANFSFFTVLSIEGVARMPCF